MADRREVLTRAMLFSAGLGLAGTTAARASTGPNFAPGAGPMHFSRRLVRNLAGGGAIEVERIFAIQFSPTAGGFAVSGQQTGVLVNAPAALEAFADIERQRVESGLFPIKLDPRGAIQEGPSLSATQATRDAAAKALELLDGPNTISDPALYRQFLMQVQQSAARFMSRLPADLFAPSAQPVVSKRQLSLPGDLTGEVEVIYKTAADPATGLMTTARREVTTRIGNDSRTAQEAWKLTPA